MNTIPVGVPIPFSVTALGPDLMPAGGVSVLYAVTAGSATLACGLPVCAVAASGDGHASMDVTAHDATGSIVTASLTNGSSLQAEFSGGTPPVIAALTPQLSLAAGASIAWTVRTSVLNKGAPAAGQTVSFQTGSTGIAIPGPGVAVTDSMGVATKSLSVGPLAEGQEATATACANGTNQCASFTAFGARPEYSTLQAISGTMQSLDLQSTPAQVTLRLIDMDGNPMAGGLVMFYEALYAWSPSCSSHGVCNQAQLLSTQTAAATSAIDGTVNFTPVSLPGLATTLHAVATSGNTSAVDVLIEQHP
jgi:hypothetical protein